MLTSLSIKNFILIDSLNLDFDQGLCVLSGETGAGKSIILDALTLVLGERANTKLIKDESRPAIISAEFNIESNLGVKTILNENGFDSTNDLVLKRTLEANGKTKCFINDTIASLSLLEKVGEELIEISSQHDQKGLFNSAVHREILDEFASLAKEIAELATIHTDWKAAENNLAAIIANEISAEDEKNHLQYIINEICDLNPKQGEEEALNSLRANLREKTKIQEIASNSLNETLVILPKINTCIKALSKMPTLFSEAERYFETALIELNEGISVIERINEQFNNDETDLNYIEERLFNLRNLARKYQCTTDELEHFLTKTTAKLALIANYAKSKQDLEKCTKTLKQSYFDKAKTISKQRQKFAAELEKSVQEELKSLKMAQADFIVEIAELNEAEWAKHGIDKIKFLARTNPGSKFEAINRIASGGELSRFFLSLKIALARIKSSPTLIFDEIDVGVGGAVADSIGKKLSLLASHAQLLVITHQPQVAAYSNHHYLVTKEHTKQKTDILVKSLNKDGKLQEVARMLSGEKVTKESILAAETLIEKAA